MFERFTRDARSVVMAALGEAERRGDRHVGTEHLLLGLIASPDAVASTVVTDHDLDLHRARRTLSEADEAALAAVGVDVDGLPRPDRPIPRRGRRMPRSPFTDGAKQTLEAALREALGHSHRHIGPEHVLLALCARTSPDPGVALLTALGASPTAVRASVEQHLDAAA